MRIVPRIEVTLIANENGTFCKNKRTDYMSENFLAVLVTYI